MSQTHPHTLTSIKIKFHQIVNTWCHSIALEKGTRITGQRYSFWTLYPTLLMTSDNLFLNLHVTVDFQCQISPSSMQRAAPVG